MNSVHNSSNHSHGYIMDNARNTAPHQEYIMNPPHEQRNVDVMNPPPSAQRHLDYMDSNDTDSDEYQEHQEYLVDELYSRTNHNYGAGAGTQNGQLNGVEEINGVNDYSLNQTNPFLPGFEGDQEIEDTPENEMFYYMDIEMSLGQGGGGFDSDEDDEDDGERFGFSVMGGIEEGFPATIDEVLEGSPADKADLEVGDEITEVNGESIEGASHSQIIEHIHECIATRNIKLRVKRRTSESAHTLSSSEVQDAYVIGVEDEARQRLQQISSERHGVKAVDLATIATDNNRYSSSRSASEKSHHSESESGESVGDFGQGSKQSPVHHEPVVLIKGAHSGESSTEDVMLHHHNYEDVMDQDTDQENVPNHREMAIDCPTGFVGIKKEPPRLPPQLQNHYTPGGSSNSPRGTPSKRRALDNATNRSLTNSAQNYRAAEDHEQLERIKKYQEDLRKRKEEEERITREQDFLRTSLRGSKKLQELEENKPPPEPVGIENPNYLVEEDEDEDYTGNNKSSAASSATLPVRTLNYEGLIQQPLAVEDLFASLHRIESRLRAQDGDEHELAPIQQLLRDPRFQNAVHVHNRVVQVALRQPPAVPATHDTSTLVDTVRHAILSPTTPTQRELAALLGKPHMEALFYTHDKVAVMQQERLSAIAVGGVGGGGDDEAEREYLYERASQYGEESIKIVHINKTADPLGATVRNEGDGSVVIGRIVRGGAAEASGLLHEGDEILEINGTDIRGRNVDDVCELMAGLTGTLTFLIIPTHQNDDDATDVDVTATRNNVNHRMVHVRAHFDYDPLDDPYIPCRELGLSFQKSDILHVIAQDDPCWWQAYRDGEDTEHALAGLIPSRSFMETLEQVKQNTIDSGDSDTDGKKQRCRCRCRHKKRSKKKKNKKKEKMYKIGGEDADAEDEDVSPYEEVVSYYPQPNRKRPIVLIGAPYVGRHELRQRLMESDPDRFAAAVPYTTRVQHDDEVDGQHYHFVRRAAFEADIADHKFVEYGEYEKNLYGTSIEAIRTVVTAGKICVLNLHPQSLRILKNSDLKPYIVFVAPPNIEKLKEMRIASGNKVSDGDLKETIERAREMEETYGHYFDFIIVNCDIDRAYDELFNEINRLEVERQWVPAQWQA